VYMLQMPQQRAEATVLRSDGFKFVKRGHAGGCQEAELWDRCLWHGGDGLGRSSSENDQSCEHCRL